MNYFASFPTRTYKRARSLLLLLLCFLRKATTGSEPRSLFRRSRRQGTPTSCGRRPGLWSGSSSRATLGARGHSRSEAAFSVDEACAILVESSENKHIVAEFSALIPLRLSIILGFDASIIDRNDCLLHRQGVSKKRNCCWKDDNLLSVKIPKKLRAHMKVKENWNLLIYERQRLLGAATAVRLAFLWIQTNNQTVCLFPLKPKSTKKKVEKIFIKARSRLKYAKLQRGTRLELSSRILC